MKILFVCTGNTCRSPMAEHLFRHLLNEAGKTKIDVESAGIAPAIHLEFPSHAKVVLTKEGVMFAPRRAQGLTADLVRESNWILVMEDHHRDSIVSDFPDAKEKVYLLKEFAGLKEPVMGIVDPFGGSVVDYEKTLAEIKKSLLKILPNI